jgi:hypothetical protein
MADNGPIMRNTIKVETNTVMRTTTAHNHKMAIIRGLEYQFSSAIMFRPTLPSLVEQFNQVCQGYKSWAILPQWVKDDVACHRSALMQRINRDYIIQLYILRNGDKVISRHAWDSFDEETRQFIRDGGELPIKTFWVKLEETCAKDGTITRVSRPTNDVYFDAGTMAVK